LLESFEHLVFTTMVPNLNGDATPMVTKLDDIIGHFMIRKG